MAHAALGHIKDAEEEEKLFDKSLTNPEIQGYQKRNLHNNMAYDPDRECGMLNVARQMLRGELLYRKGQFSAAFEHLRRAVELDDGLKVWDLYTDKRRDRLCACVLV